MSVATVDAAGLPNVRTVLMRFLDERGPGFVTALTSTKGREIADTGVMAVSVTWPAMYRAIRFRGRAVEVDRAEVLAYWDSRPWASRISAWTSQQSEPIGSRESSRPPTPAARRSSPTTGGEDDVPVPDFWGGYRVVPDEVEFWAGRRNRLHDRLVFTRVGDGDLGDAVVVGGPPPPALTASSPGRPPPGGPGPPRGGAVRGVQGRVGEGRARGAPCAARPGPAA